MYFTYRGIPSYQMGITVTKRPTFTVAAQQLSTYDTPGLDGILVENEGKHSIVIQMDIVIDNMDMFDDINEWLTGKGRFTRSDYPDRYMDVEVQSGLFNQFVGSTYYQTPISFYAYDPYWYPTENVDRPFRNLIKNDFSDFITYQGAVVTRNKTYPIDVFKGGRNLLLNSSFTENSEHWSGNPTIVDFDGKKCGHIQHTTLQQNRVVSQNVFDTIEPNATYTLSGWVRTDNIVKGTTNSTCMFYQDGYYDNNGTSTWFGYGSKAFPLNTDTGSWQYLTWTFTTDHKLNTATKASIMVHTRDLTGDIYFYNLKLEKGNIATEYSPAPEDGYGLDLPNGAYHIQTSGGTHVLKSYVGPGASIKDEYDYTSVKVHPFKRMNVNNNGSSRVMKVNELDIYGVKRLGNGTTHRQLQFISPAIEEDLDFITSDPHITDLVLDEWLPVTNEIVNNGTTASKPILRITRGDIGTADLTVNGTRFLYIFQGTTAGTQVEIDFNLRTAKEGDTLTTPNLMIGYAYPIVDVGKNEVINKGNHKVEIRRESRYL